MMSMVGQRVLVTGARLPAALEIARGLRAVGATVWAADSVRLTPAGASRAVQGFFHFPSPALQPARFRKALLHKVSELGITMIIPVSEEIFFLAQMRAELPPTTTLFAPDLADLQDLHSKWRVLERAAGCGVRIPRTARAESIEELRELVAREPGSVLKPEYSRGAYQARLSPPADLTKIPAGHFPWLVQERLSGEEISTFALTSKGRVLACASYIPRYRAGAGASLYFEPVASPPAQAFLERFAGKNLTTGHLGFDFMQGADSELTLLECNPRVTSGLHLLAGSESWARVYSGEAAAAPRGAVQSRSSKLGVISMHALPAWAQGRLGELRADLRRSRDTCFRGDDPLPSVALALCSLEIAIRSLAWPVKMKHSYTFDLEWNGGAP